MQIVKRLRRGSTNRANSFNQINGLRQSDRRPNWQRNFTTVKSQPFETSVKKSRNFKKQGFKLFCVTVLEHKFSTLRMCYTAKVMKYQTLVFVDATSLKGENHRVISWVPYMLLCNRIMRTLHLLNLNNGFIYIKI